MTMKRFVPEVVSGYNIAPCTGLFSVVVPEASANLIPNPRFINGITDYGTTGSGSIARTIEQQRRGKYSIKCTVTGTSGGVTTSVTSTNGVTYSFSVDVLGRAGTKYEILVEEVVSFNVLARKIFYSDNEWVRPSVTFVGGSAGSSTIYVKKVSGPAHSFYVDGFQYEQKAYATTYFDGDMQGYVVGETAYWWKGLRHNSISYRAETTNSGGKEYLLKDLGFEITGYTGLGMVPVNNFLKELTAGGSFYNGTIATSRVFSLIGSIFSTSSYGLGRKRKAIADILKFNRTPFAQPILMKYRSKDNRISASEYNIKCVYQSGLEGNISNGYQEQLAIQFVQPYPFVENDVMIAEDLDDYRSYNQTIAGGIAIKQSNGDIIDVISASDGIVQAMAYDKDGRLFFGGTFDNCTGGINVDNGAAVWDGTSVQNLGADGDGLGDATGPTTRTVNKILPLPNGKILFAGTWTKAGVGAADTNKAYLCAWNTNTSAWETFGTMNNVVEDLIYIEGTIYASGSFTHVTNPDYVWSTQDGTTWTSVGTPAAATQRMVGWRSGNVDILYAAQGNKIVMWNGSTWSDIYTPSGTWTYPYMERVIGTNVYVVARKYISPGVYEESLILINGTRVTTIASTGQSSGRLHCLGRKGNILIAGLSGPIIAESTYMFPNGYFGYIHSGNFYPGTFSMPGKVNCFIAKDPNSHISDSAYAYYNSTTEPTANWTGYIHHYHTVVNDGDAVAYPTIEVTGPCDLYFIHNVTTDQFTRFNPTLVNDGETVSLISSPEGYSVKSSYEGDISGRLYGARDPNITLNRGSNRFIVNVMGSKTVSGSMYTTDDANIYGATDSNTDNGKLYVTTTNVGPGTSMKWEFYKNSGKTQKVAEASSTITASGEAVYIEEKNSSGITGWMLHDSTKANGNAEIKVPLIRIFWKDNHFSLDGAL